MKLLQGRPTSDRLDPTKESNDSWAIRERLQRHRKRDLRMLDLGIDSKRAIAIGQD
jgi:hypothetical protein